MEKFVRENGEVQFERVTPTEGGVTSLQDLLKGTKVDHALLVTGMTGSNAIGTLQEFCKQYKEEVVLAMQTEDSAIQDAFVRKEKLSETVNILACLGFEDITLYTGEVNSSVMLCHNERWADFVARLSAYFAGACMAGSSYKNMEYLQIFADCFEGGENGRVLDFMEQMCKALGHGKISSTIIHAIEDASKIRKYTAEKSSIF